MTSFSTEEFLTVAEVAARLEGQRTDRAQLDRRGKATRLPDRPARTGLPFRFRRFVDDGYTQSTNASGEASKARAFWEGSEESVGDIQEP